MNLSIVKVAQKLAEADLTTSEISTILYQALRGGGNNLDQKEVNALIWQNGMVESMSVVGEVLTSALMGGDSGSGKASE